MINNNSTNCIASDLIPIVPSATFILSGLPDISYLRNKYVSFYDKDKKYIKRTGANNVDKFSIVAPDNARYCNVGINSPFDSEEIMNQVVSETKTQLEYSSTLSEFQKYLGKDYSINTNEET